MLKKLSKLKASQKGKNSGRYLLIITFEQHLDSCSHKKQYAFGLDVFNACEVEENQCSC